MIEKLHRGRPHLVDDDTVKFSDEHLGIGARCQSEKLVSRIVDLADHESRRSRKPCTLD